MEQLNQPPLWFDLKKYNELKGNVKFHFIGHLQTNKVKKAVEIFEMIQTVDSFKLAIEIDKHLGKTSRNRTCRN